MKKINLYNFITKFNYKNFILKQIIYALNPIKHFKESILYNKNSEEFNNTIKVHKQKEIQLQKSREKYLKTLTTDKLEIIFETEIIKRLESEDSLKENICFDCFDKEIFSLKKPSISIFKEGFCSCCKENKPVLNIYLYRQIHLKHGFSFDTWNESKVPFIL